MHWLKGRGWGEAGGGLWRLVLEEVIRWRVVVPVVGPVLLLVWFLVVRRVLLVSVGWEGAVDSDGRRRGHERRRGQSLHHLVESQLSLEGETKKTFFRFRFFI